MCARSKILYMQLISWTLRSGSEQFIYNWNRNNADLDQETEASKKERTRQQRKGSIWERM
jgi:hypothetical protein